MGIETKTRRGNMIIYDASDAEMISFYSNQVKATHTRVSTQQREYCFFNENEVEIVNDEFESFYTN